MLEHLLHFIMHIQKDKIASALAISLRSQASLSNRISCIYHFLPFVDDKCARKRFFVRLLFSALFFLSFSIQKLNLKHRCEMVVE